MEALSGIGKEVGCDLEGKNISNREGSPIQVKKNKEKVAYMVENQEPHLEIDDELLQVIQNRKKI